MTYRPDIDGLRAVAVMAVVLYHAGFASFAGGFVGVDVFLVISGYLITALILREVRNTGTFRFARFYSRRIRRLVPALLATVALTWLGATLVLPPALMADFAASVPTSLLSVSNIWFWFEADYFAAASNTKPLLHTWSLSVEEQFYLVWPALAVFVLAKLPRAFAVAAVLLLGYGSLVLAEHWLATDRNAAFYLLPARVCELAMGAVLAWIVPLWDARREGRIERVAEEGGLLVGLAMIGWAIATYDHHTPFPGASALLPCMGAVLVVMFGRARFAGSVLRLPTMLWTGKISYSLYLVHWPITVFAIALSDGTLSTVEKSVIVALSLALGAWMHAAVETRFRHGQLAPWRFNGAIVACLTLLALPALTATDGWRWRVPAERLTRTDAEWRALVRTSYCASPAPKGTLAGDNPDLATCQNYRKKRRDIYLWGDSHALHLAAGFARTYPAYNVHVLTMSGCVPQSGFGGYVRDLRSSSTDKCVAHNRRVLDLLERTKPANIVITSAKRSSPRRIAKATREILGRLNATDHKVAVLADFMRPGRSLANCRAVPVWLVSDADLARRCAGNPDDAKRELRYNRSLAKLLPELVRVHDVQCPQGRCRFTHKGKLLYRDSHHLNADGSKLFVRSIRDRLPFTTNRTKQKALKRAMLKAAEGKR